MTTSNREIGEADELAAEVEKTIAAIQTAAEDAIIGDECDDLWARFLTLRAHIRHLEEREGELRRKLDSYRLERHRPTVRSGEPCS